MRVVAAATEEKRKWIGKIKSAFVSSYAVVVLVHSNPPITPSIRTTRSHESTRTIARAS